MQTRPLKIKKKISSTISQRLDLAMIKRDTLVSTLQKVWLSLVLECLSITVLIDLKQLTQMAINT